MKDNLDCHLATRVPKRLWRAIKLHCLKKETPLQVFVEAAIREKLRAAVPER